MDPAARPGGHGAGSGTPVSRQPHSPRAGSAGSFLPNKAWVMGLDRLKLRQRGWRPQAWVPSSSCSWSQLAPQSPVPKIQECLTTKKP